MIEIAISEEGVPQIWDADDWLKLREEYRIVGSFVGSIAGRPYQEIFKGLPVILLPEEATLLKERKIARLVMYPTFFKRPSGDLKKKFEKYRQTVCQEQLKLLVEERKREIHEKIDVIVEGKKRKLLGLSTKKKSKRKEGENELMLNELSTNESDIVDKNEVLEEELSKIKTPPESCTTIQIFTKTPWLKRVHSANVTWNYPSTPSEVLKYKVFRHFWEDGYFLTSGNKFGGDFLVYPGDPLKFHAYFLVLCIDKNAPIRPVNVAMLSRLGSAVRKSVVLACENKNGTIDCQTLKWCSMKQKEQCSWRE